MSDSTLLAFRCLNPDCSNIIRMTRPASSGVYEVSCPYCKVTKNIKLKGMDEFQDNSSLPPVSLEDDFIKGVTYKILCPHCKKQDIGFNSSKEGKKEFACPSCGGLIILEIREKTKAVTVTEQISLIPGKIVLQRKGWLNKDYKLKPGKNTIGRYDEAVKSDIAIKSDATMSRRSVEIDVVETEKGYKFKLKILNAANPVFHNQRLLAEGESVSLNFGDILLLGKSRFRFEKDS